MIILFGVILIGVRKGILYDLAESRQRELFLVNSYEEILRIARFNDKRKRGDYSVNGTIFVDELPANRTDEEVVPLHCLAIAFGNIINPVLNFSGMN